MDSTLHSHIAGLQIKERIEAASATRLARDVRPSRRWRPRLAMRRRTPPISPRKVGTGSV